MFIPFVLACESDFVLPPSLEVLVPTFITHRQGPSPSLKSSHASKKKMSSKSATSKFDASAGATGSNFGENSSKIDVDGVSAATSENGSGEEKVMKTGMSLASLWQRQMRP